MRFGEGLTGDQLLVLQAIADNVSNVDHQVARRTRIADSIRDLRAAKDPDAVLEHLDDHLATLLAHDLIHHKDLRGEPHYGITSDGYRCHSIDVSGIA
jgi:hypothetical protein